MLALVIPPKVGRWRAGRFWPWSAKPEPVEIDEATAAALAADPRFRVELIDAKADAAKAKADAKADVKAPKRSE